MRNEIPEVKIVLSKETIFSEEHEYCIGDRCYVLPLPWLQKNIGVLFEGAELLTLEDVESFVGSYDPDEEGALIYEAAQKAGVIEEEYELIYPEEEWE